MYPLSVRVLYWEIVVRGGCGGGLLLGEWDLSHPGKCII